MATLLFIVTHVCAALFAAWALVVTIPLHLIYAVLRSRERARVAAGTAAAAEQASYVRCPACREPVRWDASKCKHCGEALAPPPKPPLPAGEQDGAKSLAIAIGALVVLVLLAKACDS